MRLVERQMCARSCRDKKAIEWCGNVSRGVSAEQIQSELAAARKAGLKYVSCDAKGIRRVKTGVSFRYLDARGRRISDARILQRIKSLVIPPAWTDVWICRDARGHLQATGRDVKGRKQYRYHPDWRRVRDETKYERMLLFSRALPVIRRRVHKEIRTRNLGRNTVLAAIVRLLDLRAARVGNEQYAKENGSFGLTTLQNRHAHVKGTRIELDFTGKSRVHQHLTVEHPVLSRIVRKCQHLPGQKLFEYVDENKKVHRITSDDVNGYIASIAGDEFTSKDFRTWKATVLCLKELQTFPPDAAARNLKRNVVRAIECVASNLGNTPAICRKCYIHPQVLERYLDGTLFRKKFNVARAARSRWFSADECALIRLLNQDC
jgi:DNA topoisomerase-1